MDFSPSYGSFFVVKIKSLEKKIAKLGKQAADDEISPIKIKTSKSLLSFVILFSLVLFLTSASTMYLEGATQHVALKYHFVESQVSLVVGCRAIGLLLSLIIVAFAAKSSHKPLLSTFGVLVSALGIVLFSVPYFVDADLRNAPLTCSRLPYDTFVYGSPSRSGNSSNASTTFRIPVSPAYFNLSTCSDSVRLSGSNQSKQQRSPMLRLGEWQSPLTSSATSSSLAPGKSGSSIPSQFDAGTKYFTPSTNDINTPVNFEMNAASTTFLKRPNVSGPARFFNDRKKRGARLKARVSYGDNRKLSEAAKTLAGRAVNSKRFDDGIYPDSFWRRSDSENNEQLRQKYRINDHRRIVPPHPLTREEVNPSRRKRAAVDAAKQSASSPLDQCSCAEDALLLARRQRALSVLCVGSFLLGLGVGMFVTVAWLYVEENGEKRKSTLLYGILLTMSGLGQLIGACLYWWFSANAENLERDTELYPWTIRAWWLGMLILAILLFLCFPFFLVFPKWIAEPEWSKIQRIQTEFSLRKKLQLYNAEKRKYREKKRKLKKKNDQDAGGKNGDSKPGKAVVAIESTNGLDAVAEEDEDNVFAADRGAKGVTFGGAEVRHLETEIEDKDEDHQLNQIRKYLCDRRMENIRKPNGGCTVLKEIICGITLPVCLLAIACAAFLPAGYQSVMNTYSSVQYDMLEIDAWFYSTGLAYGLAWTVGPLVGALIIHKLKLELRGVISMCIVLLLTSIICFLIIFAFSCPRDQFRAAKYTGYASSLMKDESVSCFESCRCSNVQYQPVCSKENERFPTPCHAGCLVVRLVNTSVVYSECSCTRNNVSASYCSSSCPIFGAYWVFLFLASLSQAVASVNVFLIFLRIVEEEYRLFSLSFSLWTIVLIAYIPGPAIFRAIQSASCLLTRSTCFGESECWLYDLDLFRYSTHGAIVCFFFVAILLFATALAIDKFTIFKFRSNFYEESLTIGQPISSNHRGIFPDVLDVGGDGGVDSSEMGPLSFYEAVGTVEKLKMKKENEWKNSRHLQLANGTMDTRERVENYFNNMPEHTEILATSPEPITPVISDASSTANLVQLESSVRRSEDGALHRSEPEEARGDAEYNNGGVNYNDEADDVNYNDNNGDDKETRRKVFDNDDPDLREKYLDKNDSKFFKNDPRENENRVFRF